VPAYPCAFEHAEFVADADLPPQRQCVIREGNDHDSGLSARRDLAGGGAQDRGTCLLHAGHAGQTPVRPVAEWLCEKHGSLAAAVALGTSRSSRPRASHGSPAAPGRIPVISPASQEGGGRSIRRASRAAAASGRRFRDIPHHANLINVEVVVVLPGSVWPEAMLAIERLGARVWIGYPQACVVVTDHCRK
jgi:hypothetical protein